MSKYRYCVFFTKLFPYGFLENYIFNELEYLNANFEKVVLVPHEEFEYPSEKNRMPVGFDRIEIAKINRDLPPLSSAQKISFAMKTALMLGEEILFGREKGKHLKQSKALFGQLFHIVHSAYGLDKKLRELGMNSDNTVFYQYWFHRGVTVSGALNRFFSDKKFFDVSRAHSLDLYHKNWNDIYKGEPLFLPYEYNRWKEIDRVFTISTHGFNHLTKTFPHFKNKLSIARLGVPGGAFTLREKANDRKIIITCSLLNANKRLHLLPDILQHTHSAIDWYHFGHGSNEDKDAIRAKCDACPNDVRVHFMGNVPNTTILAFYKEHAVDLIANLSEAEGIPVALMEAASHGVPMLATHTVGNPEIVNNDNGFIIPIHFKPQEVATLINSIFDDFEVWKKKSIASRETWETRYNATTNYSEFYAQLVSKNKL
jgi:glycosyltransferase involved in cell wall biosynthesis